MVIKAWHFVNDTLRDGQPVPPDGEPLEYDGTLELCASGLHASRRIIDALKYAPGSTCCRVECDGEIVEGEDKLVCNKRTILWRVDAEGALRQFAKQCALGMAHLWNPPQVVMEFLNGDNSKATEASAAASAASSAAAEGYEWAVEKASTAAEAVATWEAAEAARAASRAALWASAVKVSTVMWREASESHNQRLEQLISDARK